MSNLTQSSQNKLNSVRDLLQSCQKQIAAAIPKHMDPERMARIAFSAAQRQPLLFECTAQSLALSVINCAELGLEPSLLGEAYLVPYRNGKTGNYECQLIPGYKGLLKLARQSGMVTSFQVGVAREGDVFEYEKGSNKHLKHIPKSDGDAKITHFWAGAVVDGEFEFEAMSLDQVEKIRKKSKAAERGPWVDHFEEMGKKTVLKRLCKLLPATSEVEAGRKLAKAVALEERADAGLPPAHDLIDLGPAEEVPPPTGTEARLEAKVTKGKAKATLEPEPASSGWEGPIPARDSDELDIASINWPSEKADRFIAARNAYDKEGKSPEVAHELAWQDVHR